MKLERIYNKRGDWKVEIGVGNTLYVFGLRDVAIFCNQFLVAVAQVMSEKVDEWVAND